MIRIEIDGPANKCEAEVKGSLPQILAEANLVVGCLLANLESTGLPVAVAAELIGANLGTTVESFRRAVREKDEH